MDGNRKRDVSMPAGKRVLFAILAVIFCFVLAAVIAEIGLRLFLPQQESMRFFASSDRYGYELKKSFHQRYRYVGSDFVMDVRTDSIGLRDREYAPAEFSRPGLLRVFLIGDSFAFGQGVNMPDHYGRKLEDLLNAAGLPATVIKSGVPGWGTVQETRYARDHFGLFRPDVIVLTFSGNDPGDDVAFGFGMRNGEKGVIRFPGKTFVRDHSHLYRFLFYRFKSVLDGAILKKKAVRSGEGAAIDTQSAAIITEAEWERSLQTIRTFRDEFVAFNPRGIVLVQASAPWNAGLRDRLKGLTNGSDLFYIDLFDAVSSLVPGERRLPYDGHWSIAMHSISARALAGFLEARARETSRN
ncbi:MAG TPA: SGNH/GDSL hydrolase family protein [Candidatus Krumholzibacteriaceae bacterium]